MNWLNTWKKPPEFSQALPAFGHTYLEQLIGEYRSLPVALGSPPDADAAKAIGVIEDVMGKHERAHDAPEVKRARAVEAAHPDGLTWGDVAAFDLALLRLYSFEQLRRKAWRLRVRYRDVAGHRAYDEYMKSHPPDENDDATTEEELRTDMEGLLAELNLLYALTPERESKRNWFSQWTALTAGGVLLAVLLLTIVMTYVMRSQSPATLKYSRLPTYGLVLAMGALGGYISMQRRLQVSEGDPIDNLAKLTQGRFYGFIAVSSGAIFALLLSVVFAAGFLKGDLFPDLVYNDKGDVHLFNYIERIDLAQFSKLLVWSFIAGFAERFVPDALDRMVVKKAESTQQPST
jgi:hypothetical protein